MSLMKKSIKLVCDFGILQVFLSNAGITTGKFLLFSSSVYKNR